MEEKQFLINKEWSIGEFKFILNQPIEKELLKYKTYIKMHNVILNCIKTAQPMTISEMMILFLDVKI